MLKSVLERIAEVTAALSQLRIKNSKMDRVSVAPNNPEQGNFRVITELEEGVSIMIAEFLREGQIQKYTYALVEGNVAIIRYDNAPHHKEVRTHPHHKHVAGIVKDLQDPSLELFIKEVSMWVHGRKGN